jgi:hypothetical protein
MSWVAHGCAEQRELSISGNLGLDGPTPRFPAPAKPRLRRPDFKLATIGGFLSALALPPYNGAMSEGHKPSKRRPFQVKLHNVFAATFWIGVACAAIGMVPNMRQPHQASFLWLLLAGTSVMSALWSLANKYRMVLVTVLYTIIVELFLAWLAGPSLFD